MEEKTNTNISLTFEEKAELLKPTICFLYTKEGRTKSYIGRLLQIDRKIIALKIAEWNLPEPTSKKRLSPSNQKFVNKNRNFIISKLRNNVSITKIAKELNISYNRLEYYIAKDEKLHQAHEEYIHRKKTVVYERRERRKEQSNRNSIIEEIPEETWTPLLGYEEYYVSNMGRVKHYIKTYKTYSLLTNHENQKNGRIYVTISQDNKKHNLSVARLVALNFVDGHTEKKNTVNHIDGNIHNNRFDNLEWTSQDENNKHSYDALKRKSTYGNRYKNKYSGKIFVYRNHYEFKTVTALSKFIHKSETQTRRYLEEPEKHDIKIVNKSSSE